GIFTTTLLRLSIILHRHCHLRDLHSSPPRRSSDLKLVTRLAREANEFQIEKNRDREEKLIGELEDSGMEVNALSAEEKDAFRAKLSPIYSEYRDVWGPDMSQAFIPKGL